MRKLLLAVLGVLLVSALALAEPPKKVLIFPFNVKGDKQQVGVDIATVVGAELMREGDIEVLSGKPLAEAVQAAKVNPARIARILTRTGAGLAIWGTVTKLTPGYSLDASVLQSGQGKKPRILSITGKDMEDLIEHVKELALQISNLSLNGPKIGAITIEGNKRIPKDSILAKLDVKVGTPFHKFQVADAIREIYSMSYFDDVRVKAEKAPDGSVNLHITVVERPSIKKIEIQGNTVFSTDQILDKLTTKSFQVVSLVQIRDDMATIRKMYEKKGYYQPEITYQIKELNPSEANLIFKVKEGSKSYLTKIVLEGRKSLPANDLKKILTVKQKSWFWFLDESGTFTRQKLEQNRMRLMLYYMDHGFIKVQVAAPEMKIKDGDVTVTYQIHEGDRYQVRKVGVEGDLILPKKKIVSLLKLTPKTWFSRSVVGEDIKTLTRLYNNQGYAYADIEPMQTINDKYDFVDFTYRIHKGQRVTIEKVDIVGNDRTRDKIIRRALAISAGDLYSADRLKATKDSLEAMDFFQSVQLKTSPGSRPDLMDVVVSLMEKKTGSIQAGLGYSSQDGAMGNISLRERNLLGLGIIVDGKSNITGRRTTFEGSFTYPWMFDIPLTGSARAYRSQGKESQFVRGSQGFGLSAGYPLYGRWTMSAGIARDSSKLSNFNKTFARSVMNYYKRYGTKAQKFMDTTENSFSFSFNRDTRNSAMIPSAGSKISLGGRLSGFGGDIAFSSYSTQAAYYHRLFWKAILKFRLNASLLEPAAGQPIPFDRRIVYGGIQSIRGYNYGEIGPKDRYGNIIGGDRGLIGNIECLFPLVESLKLNGVFFFDAGDAWNSAQSPFLTEIKAGFGGGFRWLSPMGPIRIEYGWKVHREKGEKAGEFAFGMGRLF
jgi:outer membrane protein insertion porin family